MWNTGLWIGDGDGSGGGAAEEANRVGRLGRFNKRFEGVGGLGKNPDARKKVGADGKDAKEERKRAMESVDWDVGMKSVGKEHLEGTTANMSEFVKKRTKTKKK
jgi:hypothetical protein